MANFKTAQDLIESWRLHPDPEVGSCANQLAGWLRTQTPVVDVHKYLGDPKHCHQCALAAWVKEWKRCDMLQAELDRLLIATRERQFAATELRAIAAFFRQPGAIWSEDAVDECARVLEKRAHNLSASQGGS